MRITQSIVDIPFRSLVRNALSVRPSRRAIFWSSEAGASAVFSTGVVYHSTRATREGGVPLLLAPPCRSAEFATGLLRSNGMARDGVFGFVVEHPGSVVALVQTRNLPASSNGELKRLPVGTLLPASELPEGFCWEILSPEFEPLNDADSVPAAVLVVGVPQNVCWWAETWAEIFDGRLLGVWPALLAVLHWCRAQTAEFALIPGGAHSFLALFDSGRLRLLMKLPPAGVLAATVVEDLVAQIRQELQLGPSTLYVHPWDHSLQSNAPVHPPSVEGYRSEANFPAAVHEELEGRVCVLKGLVSMKGL